MRGSAMVSRRSRNSHMRSPRSVTCAPIGMPSRSLNCAMDLRALVTCGFCPVIAVRSLTAPSSSLADTHVDHDLRQTGDLHDVGVGELLLHRGDDLLAVAGLQPRTLVRGG